MLKNIIENDDFKNLSQRHIKDIIQYIIDTNTEFSVVANIESTSFNPDLPNDIKSNLNKFSLFTLAGYTFTTVRIEDDFLYFEAGFGKDNFGSVLKIPLYSILQIIIDENIIYINLTATVDKFNNNLEKNSFNVFKNNPKNKKFN
ncbi:hypothetical protein [Aliarcobacter vitoriensis]|uniref:Stringent starvation protein B n=1 Tax=Aliarcobacter vitoriensis TaxID=2011099 RepID=A0A366MS17_9BACT|nr:hypothetical protein [Aliarcobacter vitoriensis]RBQ29078.1 hypothetical protein CRU91_05710 [Aliarcobacter vitoriensis]RBQ32572.1 hypothetical protein CRU92_02340 [Arcobacter sp. FW59]